MFIIVNAKVNIKVGIIKIKVVLAIMADKINYLKRIADYSAVGRISTARNYNRVYAYAYILAFGTEKIY